MIIKYEKAARKSDIQEILNLQRLNLRKNISNSEISEYGFVFVSHSLADLLQLNKIERHIIAKDGTRLVGYCLAMTKDSQTIIPSLYPMFEEFESIAYQGKKISESNYIVIGQVCIAKEYRNKGIFRKLYEAYRNIYVSKFDFAITEISTGNLRSLAAHQKIGFKILCTYHDISEEWAIVIWDWKEMKDIN